MSPHIISAGGVVYKKEGENFFILLCQHAKRGEWVFPKGRVGDKIMGESIKDAALREVREESGAIGEIDFELTPTSFWYTFNGEKQQKTVHYFVMRFEGGDITEHDNEMQSVMWVPSTEVEGRLAYKGDKEVWKEAKDWLLAQGIGQRA
jgi:ADP-ribose pyrophosphatase YjhB (NUDIX family)